MGMFDEIKSMYPLPVEGMGNRVFQTKDFEDWPQMDLYEIREDGTLWKESYEIEDKSKAAEWKRKNPGKELPEDFDPLDAFCGCMTRVDRRMEPHDFSGTVDFYTFADQSRNKGWVEFRAVFAAGKIETLETLENTPANDQVDLPPKEGMDSTRDVIGG